MFQSVNRKPLGDSLNGSIYNLLKQYRCHLQKKVSFEPPALSSYKGNGERFYCFVLILKEKTYLEADGPYMLDVISIERSLMGLL